MALSAARDATIRARMAVLPAVVINQPIAMIATVVFDRQALKAIQEVWPAQETAVIVTDGNLNLRPGESRQHKENSEPGLHGGFGLRLREVNNTPKPSDALGFRMFGHMKAQVGDRDQPR